MATATLRHSTGLNRRWESCRRVSSNTCCRREILVLLVWQALLVFPHSLIVMNSEYSFQRDHYVSNASEFGLFLLVPFIGWLADVKVGRYKIIIYGTLAAFTANLLSSVELLLLSDDVFNEALSCFVVVMDALCYASFLAALLPFMTDQLKEATANELAQVVHWYYWVSSLTKSMGSIVLCTPVPLPTPLIAIPCTACLFMIIISDYFCQQHLNRTPKTTNPIKLIIQVLDYARKNTNPQSYGAFLIYQEQFQLEFGKKKFGGPFSEEEVEDVKTVLQLLPLMVCVSVSLTTTWHALDLNALNDQIADCVLEEGTSNWLAPLLFIPLCQFLLYPPLHNWVPNLLRRMGLGLFLRLVGFALCAASLVKGHATSGSLPNYLTCTVDNTREAPNAFVEWYWKIVPLLLLSVGATVASLFQLEFAIARSPDNMKGLVIGLIVAITSTSKSISRALLDFFQYTLCYDTLVLILQTTLFLAFLFLSKHYVRIRERNGEVSNIHAVNNGVML